MVKGKDKIKNRLIIKINKWLKDTLKKIKPFLQIKENREITILSSIVILIMIVSVIGMNVNQGNDQVGYEPDAELNNEILVETSNNSIKDEATSVIKAAPQETEKMLEPLTGLIIGLDANGGLTDVLMTVHLDTEKNELAFISVPRDLEINYQEEPFKTMRYDFNKKVQAKEIDANLHQRSYSKVNAIYYDTGKTSAGLYYTKDVVEEIIGMKIDYIAVIDVYGFKDVIDIMGGIDFDVPQDMFYNDPEQDLYIDLDKGLQHLDGDHAMQLVRFRKYPLGDLQRIQVQQDLMRELYKKVLGKMDIDTLTNVINKAYGIIDTDFGIIVALKYADYIFNLQLDNLFDKNNMITIPSWGEMEEYEQDGILKRSWHQYWDIDEAHTVVSSLLQQ